ncbi:class I SAM-dependent methyltransferase [Neobacillus muris]|uniref:class I SAM-dependent methyltransferase n=1 Tax=Neobacillus muris TaxID=2941334 RepID=UPI00203E4E34|nr:class I SAM-dependent methyltransferase [Neobacillus muris]
MGRSFAKWYDVFMSPLEKNKFKEIRRQLLSKATGCVLEIGSGTGFNFPLYEAAKRVVAIEPSPDMIERSKPKLERAQVPIEVLQASAEKLPFPDDSFDTVIATLVFCTIPDTEKAIQEMIRVCKHDGEILFFEHVKMDNPFLGTLQEWLTPAWKKICDGCCLNRDTLGLLQSHSLTIEKIENYYNGLFIYIESRNNKVKSSVVL